MSRAWRCFCVVCNVAVGVAVAGDGVEELEDEGEDGLCCWGLVAVPEAMMMVLLLPCTLMEASMWIVIGLMLVLVSVSADSSSSRSRSLWISPDEGWTMVYGGGGGIMVSCWVWRLAATSPNLRDWWRNESDGGSIFGMIRKKRAGSAIKG